jgi:hypothetical protein
MNPEDGVNTLRSENEALRTENEQLRQELVLLKGRLYMLEGLVDKGSLHLDPVKACPSCHQFIRGGERFCPWCGFNLTFACPFCESQNLLFDRFCLHCGQGLSAL